MRSNPFLTLTLVILPSLIYSQTIIPDPEFGSDGLVINDIENQNIGIDFQVRTNGKIVAIAEYDHPEVSGDFYLLQYKPDGSLDDSFGNEGRVVLDFVPVNYTPSKLLLTRDDEVLVGGNIYHFAPGKDLVCIVKFRADGSVDPTFSDGGILMHDVQSDWTYFIDMAIHDQNGFIVLSSRENGQDHEMVVSRYFFDGTLDQNFGESGRFVYNPEGTESSVSVTVQPDQSILLNYSSWINTIQHAMILRLSSNGNLDPTFAGNGVLTHLPYFNPRLIYSQENGQFIATFFRSDSTIIQRFNSDGSIDESFGNAGGTMVNRYHSDPVFEMNSISLLPDNSYLLAGHGYSNSLYGIKYMRLVPEGQVDLAFGEEGVMFNPVRKYSYSCGTRVKKGGKVLTLGYARSEGPDYNDDIMMLQYIFSDPTDIIRSKAVVGNEVYLQQDFTTGIKYLHFNVNEPSFVSLKLFSADGRLLKIICNHNSMQAGKYVKEIQTLGAGIYYLQVSIGRNFQVFTLSE